MKEARYRNLGVGDAMNFGLEDSQLPTATTVCAIEDAQLIGEEKATVNFSPS